MKQTHGKYIVLRNVCLGSGLHEFELVGRKNDCSYNTSEIAIICFALDFARSLREAE